MKNLALVFVSTLLIMGCAKSELDTQPNDRFTDDVYLTTEKNATAALSGCYNILMANGLFGYSTPLWE